MVNKNEFVEHAHVKQNRPENTRGLNRYQKAASIESLDGIETEVVENRYGTTERALLEARRVNSPCVVMVLDMDGARHWMDQRENVGMKLHFVFVRVKRERSWPSFSLGFFSRIERSNFLSSLGHVSRQSGGR